MIDLWSKHFLLTQSLKNLKYVGLGDNGGLKANPTITHSLMKDDIALPWNITSTSLPLCSWYSICFFKGYFYGFGSTTEYDNVVNDSDPTKSWIVRSKDGVNWSTVFTGNNVDHGFVTTFATNGDRLVAVGNETNVITTADGVNWQAIDLDPGYLVSGATVAYGNGVFVKPGMGNENYYSTNGVNWTYAKAPFGDLMAYHSIFANGRFYVSGYGRGGRDVNFISSCTNGTNWTNYTLPKSGHWGKIVYCNGVFLMEYNSNSNNDNVYEIYRSTNGVNWSLARTKELSASLSTFNNGKEFLLVSTEGSDANLNATTTVYHSSTDGVNWKLLGKVPIVEDIRYTVYTEVFE